MVALKIVDRFRHPADLNTYRRSLAATIGAHPLLRHLPALADLPIELLDAAGAACQLEDCLQQHQRLTLAGASGSGRELALLQYALRWAAAGAEGRPPLLLNLPQIDDGATPPAQALAAQLQPAPPAPHARFSFRRPPPAPHKPAVVLAHGLEELSPERRDGWRTALQQLPDSTTRLAVAVPEYEPAWPGYAALHIAPITPAVLTSWIEHLTPPQHRAAVDSALAPFHALHPLGDRLFEIALLAWLAPNAGLPESRAGLYAMALARLLGLAPAQLADAPAVAELQLLAAYDERPASVPAALVGPNQHGQPRFHHPQIRRYLAARQLVAEQRLDLLMAAETAEQRELALLLATLLDDPTPLYTQLWEPARTDSEYLLLLGRCLRERAPANAAWTLRVVAGLAQLARSEPGPAGARAAELLHACASALDTAIAAALRSNASIYPFLMHLLRSLPADMASSRMLQLVLHTATPALFGWQLADHLLEQPELHLPISAPLPFDDQVLARWIYLHALHASNRRTALEPALACAALQALGASGDALRTTAAATRLIEDTRLAAPIRAAAVGLLAETGQPGALATLERAADETDPSIRQAALQATARLDPARGLIAWGRAAIDRSADWELRMAAIDALGSSLTTGSAHQLAQCVSDTRLPLLARLRAIGGLQGHPAGHTELIQLLNRSDLSESVRASVARALGAAGYAPALRDLLRLLEAPPAMHTLLESCCAGLGALRDPDATEPLLQLLERTFHDPQLTIAAISALGQIGDARATAPLGQLLGAEALQRLERTLTPRLLQLPIESCRDNSAIPPRLIEQLAATLANAITPEVQPSTLGEFLASEADRVRVAAAQALVAIGGNAARAALLAALLDDTAGSATADLIAALADIDGRDTTDVLGYLIEASEITPLTRWLVVQHLAAHPGGEPLMTRALMNGALDAFTRGALAEGLGQRRALAALPLLRQLAEDATTDTHLRAQAILGLGLLNDSTTETILLRIVGDTAEEVALRGLAADYLPSELSAEGRRMLRELLRAERQPTPLVIGALRTLGRTRDHEALKLMLQHSDDSNSSVAQAAIDAMADLGDPSVAPVLVRLAQQPNLDHALRLQAVGALLKLGGDEYRPLLRSYLQQGALPFRLLALEALIGADTPADELRALLAERGWPVALRLRLLEYLAGDIAAATLLTQLLESNDDEPQLRALAAEALGRLHWQAAAPALMQLAASADAALPIRLRCITALCQLDILPGWVTLGRLADDARQPSVIRASALQALNS